MKTSRKQIKEVRKSMAFNEQAFMMSFIMKHVPRFQRLMMEMFPFTKKWYNYSIAHEEGDNSKLTLLRGNKIIARNFNKEEYEQAKNS